MVEIYESEYYTPLIISLNGCKSGWANFDIQHNDKQKLRIDFSTAFCPFRDLVNWVDNIAKGNFPSSFVVDQEGFKVTFFADIIDNILLVILFDSDYPDLVYLKLRFNREEFYQLLKQEILFYFQNDFEPLQWGSDCNFREWVLCYRWAELR